MTAFLHRLPSYGMSKSDKLTELELLDELRGLYNAEFGVVLDNNEVKQLADFLVHIGEVSHE